MERRNRLITLSGFKEWLSSHPPETVVGHAHFEDDCPLARYLKATQGEDANVYVWEDHYYVDGREYKLPAWAEEFVLQLDLPRNEGEPVRASEALLILGNVR